MAIDSKFQLFTCNNLLTDTFLVWRFPAMLAGVVGVAVSFDIFN